MGHLQLSEIHIGSKSLGVLTQACAAGGWQPWESCLCWLALHNYGQALHLPKPQSPHLQSGEDNFAWSLRPLRTKQENLCKILRDPALQTEVRHQCELLVFRFKGIKGKKGTPTSLLLPVSLYLPLIRTSQDLISSP